ncbi:MAG: ABC transporter permease [Eubacterium sp.]|nr:ABC transporter permease [Eubacterium sp.]
MAKNTKTKNPKVKAVYRKEGRNYFLIYGTILTAFMVALVVLGYFWTPYSTTGMSMGDKFAGPSLQHIFGCDNYGRDIFSRLLEGAGTSFLIACAVVLIGLAGGILIGSLTGYFGGWPDEVLMRLCDALTAFPSILLALVIVAVVGGGTLTITWVLGILFIPGFSRIVRSQFAKIKNLNYVKSARLMGAGSFRIMFLHILPNTVPVLLTTVVIAFNNAILAEASMSYLGIGVQPPDASLGRMLSESQKYLQNSPHYVLFTGLTIVLLILGFSLLGEGLQERNGRQRYFF